MRLELPWPPRELSPNARVHFMAKAGVTQAYRMHAYCLAHPIRAHLPEEGEIVVRCEFHPPDRRRRDLDGMFASIKAALDGIADSLGVNDHRFGFQIHRREPCKNGKVVIEIQAS